MPENTDTVIAQLREQLRAEQEERDARSGRIRYLRHALANLEEVEARGAGGGEEVVEEDRPF